MTLNSLAFTPLSTIMPESQAKEWISEQRRNIKRKGDAIPIWLREQYELQLRTLESGEGADIEIAYLSAFTSGIGMAPSSVKKLYTDAI